MRKQIIDHFISPILTSQYSNLIQLHQDFEPQLKLGVQASIQSKINEVGVTSQNLFGEPGRFQFRICDSIFEGIFQPETHNPRRLFLQIIPLYGTDTRLRKKSVSPTIESIGRFNTFAVKLPEELADFETTLLKQLSEGFSYGYRKLKEFIASQYRRRTSPVVDEIYSEIRSCLPPELSKRIYLFGGNWKVGSYLMDWETLDRAISLSSISTTDTSMSPLEIALQLSERRFRFDDLVAKYAITNNEIVNMDLLDAKHSAHNYVSGIGLAESIVHRDNRLIVHPIAQNKRNWFEVSYPTEMKNSFESRISELRVRIQHIAGRRKNKLNWEQKLAVPFSNRTRMSENIGIFTGTAFGAFYRAISS